MNIKYDPSINKYIIGDTSLTQKDLIFLVENGTLPNILSKEKSTIANQINEQKIQEEFADNNIIGNNIIYFGAPGTGKSYKVTELIQKTYPTYGINNNDNVFRITIYPDYSYYNFVGSILPTMHDNKIIYEFSPGIFTLALLKALQNKNKHIFLIIEEMSRGNIASIFGDIFQLLDRRDDGYSEYFIDNSIISNFITKETNQNITKIFLPPNLSIIGTVNTNDQNVNVLDTAFKRRFEFRYIQVEPIQQNGTYLNSFTFKLGNNSFEWNALYMTLNLFIINKLNLNEDKQIGQFFIKFGTDDEHNKNLIKNKLLHYLWEDIQNNTINNEYSIFNQSIKSFSLLYKQFDENINIFSDEFLEQYRIFENHFQSNKQNED